MRRIIISILVMISMLVLNIGIVKAETNGNQQFSEDEQTGNKEDEQIAEDEGIKVLKLDYGVSVELEQDRPIQLDIDWWHNFSFNATEDLNTDIIDSVFSYSWGTQFLNYNISYSKSFFPDNEEVDNGRISFSFSQDF